ncbi:GlcNAc-PI de-N-acetylase [Mycobacterium antarcticum]|nr:GlcNAc-PI de-N-acetylase [Mycolicibacterium sp. TUM20983]
MVMPMTERVPVLMIVHAHPDDESSQTGGTLARYAAAGCHTVLVTCTDGARGDAGDTGAKPGDDGHDPRRVAAHRSGELAAAATALGVGEVVELGYPDSGLPADDERVAADAFSVRPSGPMMTRVVELIRRYEPDVLVTYPPNGLSGHPDHIRTHELVAAAHGAIANDARGGHVPRLYYIAMSVSRLRAVQSDVRGAFGADAWVPPDELGVDDSEVTTVIDVGAFWARKLAALAAHASQSDAAVMLRLFTMAGESAKSVARVEEYVRAYPPVGTPVGEIERDFFGATASA